MWCALPKAHLWMCWCAQWHLQQSTESNLNGLEHGCQAPPDPYARYGPWWSPFWPDPDTAAARWVTVTEVDIIVACSLPKTYILNGALYTGIWQWPPSLLTLPQNSQPSMSPSGTWFCGPYIWHPWARRINYLPCSSDNFLIARQVCSVWLRLYFQSFIILVPLIPQVTELLL